MTQAVPTVNDYLGMQFTLGPKGSIWALRWSYAVAPDAATFAFRLASVTEPDPDRAGVSDAGTLLRSDSLSFLSWGGATDGYAAAFADAQGGGQLALRIMGEDHDPLTAIGPGTDPLTGYAEGDGGAGVYRVRLVVTGKNGLSTGYAVRLTALAMVRLDDFGFE